MATMQTAAVGEAILRDLPGGLAATPRAATDVEFSEVELCGYGPFRWAFKMVGTLIAVHAVYDSACCTAEEVLLLQ